ncbi:MULTISPECIES: methyl-accepting chemotaxis protein [unclassified Cupriavidus]|uniref:methyl-accepting chemotaxis protein n=1 Tax=unclassified Cupriavidus TaxID=2640874 RepID=UPI00313DE2E5
MFSKSWTVRGKLRASYGALVAIVLIVSALSIYALGDANRRFAGFIDGINGRALLAHDIRTAVDRRAIAARNLVLVTTDADRKLEYAEVQRAHEEVMHKLETLQSRIASAPDASDTARRLVADIARVESRYGPVALDIVRLAMAGEREQAVTKINVECRPLLAALVQATDAYQQYTAGRAEQSVSDAEARAVTLRNTVLGISLLALAAAIGFGLLITRGLLRALGAEPSVLSAATQRVASGDLSPIDGADAAYAGSVLASMGVMQNGLVHLIGKVRHASDAIASGSAEIASGTDDLSSRTTQQAASLEETAASMEELTTTVRQTAEHATRANDLASDASDVARRGGGHVGNVVRTMHDINESSARIEDIVGIIEGIAFQTNILALNAAVEAARAGEQGRGFAVVAGEVRTLAQRSSTAAKEIKTLIHASLEKIRNGSGVAEEAGKTMSEVMHAVERVTQIIAKITSAAGEQSRGIGQINQAIVQMDEVTQRNAALVEQAAAASRSLEDQGRELDRAVAYFRAA